MSPLQFSWAVKQSTRASSIYLWVVEASTRGEEKKKRRTWTHEGDKGKEITRREKETGLNWRKAWWIWWSLEEVKSTHTWWDSWFFSCLRVFDSFARVMDKKDEAFSCVYVCGLNIFYPILFHEYEGFSCCPWAAMNHSLGSLNSPNTSCHVCLRTTSII